MLTKYTVVKSQSYTIYPDEMFKLVPSDRKYKVRVVCIEIEVFEDKTQWDNGVLIHVLFNNGRKEKLYRNENPGLFAEFLKIAEDTN